MVEYLAHQVSVVKRDRIIGCLLMEGNRRYSHVGFSQPARPLALAIRTIGGADASNVIGRDEKGW